MSSNRVSPNGSKAVLRVDMFPADVQPLLQEIDDEGNGDLEMDEITEAFTAYAKMKKAAKDGSIALAGLPKEIQPTLRVFDVDGDGTVAPMELARAAELYKDSKNMVKKLTKLSVILLLLMGVMLACITGLVFVVVEGSKETKVDPSGVQMVKGTTNPAGTAAASKEVTLYDLVGQPASVLKQVKDLSFTGEDGVSYLFTVTGIVSNPATGGVTFMTPTGHLISVTRKATVITDASGTVLLTETATSSRRKLLDHGGMSSMAGLQMSSVVCPYSDWEDTGYGAAMFSGMEGCACVAASDCMPGMSCDTESATPMCTRGGNNMTVPGDYDDCEIANWAMEGYGKALETGMDGCECMTFSDCMPGMECAYDDMDGIFMCSAPEGSEDGSDEDDECEMIDWYTFGYGKAMYTGSEGCACITFADCMSGMECNEHDDGISKCGPPGDGDASDGDSEDASDGYSEDGEDFSPAP